jgi:ATP adenylyltransferase
MSADVREIARRKSDWAACRFCDGISTRHERAIWNQPLFASQNFVVLPSLGAMVEGWLLIAPKQHYLSTAVLPARLTAELAHLKGEVSKVIGKLYGPVLAFEHGPSR